jgi:hypothetical protein
MTRPLPTLLMHELCQAFKKFDAAVSFSLPVSKAGVHRPCELQMEDAVQEAAPIGSERDGTFVEP